MTNETKHTPTPWHIRGQDILGNEPCGYICTWSGRSANAALIVRAVNAHEALVASAECAEALDAPYGKGKATLIQHGWDEATSATEFVKDMRRAALAAAKGEA